MKPDAHLSARQKQHLAGLLTFLIAGIIAYLSLSTTTGTSQLHVSDKIQHMLAYFGLSLPMTYWLGARRIVWVLILCVGYGLLMEYLQGAMDQGRMASWLDALANLAGALLGGSSVWFLTKKDRPHK